MMQSERVDLFNLIKNGTVTAPDEVALMIANQCTYLVEEVLETKEAAYERDWREVVDGIGDIEFVAAYLKTLIKNLGVDQEGAFQAICDNNMEKVTTSVELAMNWQADKEKSGVPSQIVETEHEGVRYYTIRDPETNKILKYAGFPKVDVAPFIPKELLND